MEEPTTTGETPETGAQDALPAQEVTQPAEVTTTVEPSVPSEGGEKPVPEVDDKLLSFAKGQGIEDVSELSERELKLLKVARDNQAEFQRNRQKATELEKNLSQVSDESAEDIAIQTGQDPELIKRLQRIEVRDQVRDFWDTNPDAKKYESQMIEILQAKPHLAGDLESLYATALVKSGSLDAVKSQGKREALESLAQKQQATAPIGNATNSGTAPKAKPFGELSTKDMESQLGIAYQ
jgi:hypothetical protein